MAILLNQRGLAGKETTAVAISTAFWQALITPTNVEDHNSNLTPDINHITNTDLDLMLILHKKCNTNGMVKETTIHQIYQAICDYFESPASKTQVYISMEKFIKRELVFATKNEITGLTTYKLNYFINRETGQLHRYGVASPVVFSNRFSQLSLAARKVFLMTAIRQGSQMPIFQGIRGENGLYNFLKKHQPNQLIEVINELTAAEGDKPGLLAVAKLEKYKGRYHKAYFGLNDAYKITHTDGQQFRDPIEVPTRYPRKAKFIENVLIELGIAELADQMALIINCLKYQGYRVIRQVMRQIKEFVKRNGEFPKDLAYLIKKETRIKRDSEIRDLAHEAEIFDFIAPGLTGSDRDNRIFEFTNALSSFSTEHIRKMLKSLKTDIKEKFAPYIISTFENYCFDNELASIELVSYARAYAYRKMIDVNLYKEMEEHAIRFELEKGEDHVYEWLTSRINREKAKRPPVDLTNLKIEDYILANSPYSPVAS